MDLTPEPASVALSVSVFPVLMSTVTLKVLEADEGATPLPELVGDAVRVSPRAAVLIVTANVARPEELVVAVAPDAIELAEGVRVMGRPPGTVTGLLNVSSTWTVTEGDIAVPVKAFVGC
jgi:hypothetical protein